MITGTKAAASAAPNDALSTMAALNGEVENARAQWEAIANRLAELMDEYSTTDVDVARMTAIRAEVAGMIGLGVSYETFVASAYAERSALYDAATAACDELIGQAERGYARAHELFDAIGTLLERINGVDFTAPADWGADVQKVIDEIDAWLSERGGEKGRGGGARKSTIASLAADLSIPSLDPGTRAMVASELAMQRAGTGAANAAPVATKGMSERLYAIADAIAVIEIDGGMEPSADEIAEMEAELAQLRARLDAIAAEGGDDADAAHELLADIGEVELGLAAAPYDYDTAARP